MHRLWFHYLALPTTLLGMGVLATMGLIRAFGEGPAPVGVNAAAGDDQEKPQSAGARVGSGK